eukprot:403340386
MNQLDHLAKKYKKLEENKNNSASQQKLSNIYSVSQQDDYPDILRTSQQFQKTLREAKKSPSNIFIGGQTDESPFQNTNKINTFDNQAKCKIAQKQSKSPHIRINFANNDKGQLKYEKYKNSSRNYHIAPTFKSTANVFHDQDGLNDKSEYDLIGKRSVSPFKPKDKMNEIFVENKKEWLKNGESGKVTQSNYGMMQNAAAINLKQRSQHGLSKSQFL